MEILMKEFSSFSSQLPLSESVVKKVKKLLQELTTIFNQYEYKVCKKALFACVIYIVVQDVCSSVNSKADDNDVEPDVTVSQLLEEAEINIMDFFSATCFLKTNHQLSDSSKQNLIALERKYLIVSALYDKFESMSNEVFCVDIDVGNSGNSVSRNQTGDSNELLKERKTLCWLLFLVAKAKVLWHRQELLATFHLLLCCMAEVIKATPTFLLLPPFDSIVASNENSVTILQALSDHVKTKYEEVKTVYDGWLHVANELNVRYKLPEVQQLQTVYAQLYLQSADIDETQFLNRDWHLLPNNAHLSSPRKQQPISVRRTLDTAEALNTILLSAPDDLSESLKAYLQKCTIDAAVIIKDFILRSEEAFVEEFIKAQEGGTRSLAERRFKLAVRYYYIMLDALLRKESERLTPVQLTSFLQKQIFHKSLMACCLEVTLMSCGSVGSANFTPIYHGGFTQTQGIHFPWILKVFNLEAFDFFRIIESFIRCAPTITQQIIKHLKEIEDMILEQIAWKSGSSVFSGLASSDFSPPCETKYDSFKSTPGFWSPNKDPSQRLPSTPKACHAVNIFLNKVSRLAYQRLEKLCNLLEIKKEMLGNIWMCIEHVLYIKTHLLKDRHLDQIIMCCIYAICKILDQEVRFKTIISCYSQLLHSSVSVYKQVLSEGRKEFIVTFYNKEFNSEMMDFVLGSFGDENKPESSSLLKSVQSPVVLSPAYSLPGKKNIFVSPLHQSPFKNPNDIIYRKLPSYSFGSLSQPSKTLKNINDSLNVLQPALKKTDEVRGKKHLQFSSNADPTDRREFVGNARKFLKFDEPACSQALPNFKSAEEN